MGTRADFFVGVGKDAEWIGSISFDGYPGGHPKRVLASRTRVEFCERVAEMLSGPDVLSTRPDEGWPWPWNDHRLTDYAYAWVERSDGMGAVLASRFGRRFTSPDDLQHLDEREPKLGDDQVRDMSSLRMSRDELMAKSGLLVIKS